MELIRVGVIGVGYLGAFHVQKLAQMPQVKLMAVSDTDGSRCQEVAQQYQVNGYQDYKKLLGSVDAVSIVTPAFQHFAVAKFFLENGIHVFLEKPMTTCAKDANTLIALSENNHCVLQAGFIERFNPITHYLKETIQNPLLVEATRMAPFSTRGTDVSVILDLMIHDIDLIHYLFSSNCYLQNAYGYQTQSQYLDEVHANFYLEKNNVDVRLFASRTSLFKQRSMRIVEPNKIIHADFDKACIDVYHIANISHSPETAMSNVAPQRINFSKQDLLQIELKSFIEAIALKQKPTVSGQAGEQALLVANQIQIAISGAIMSNFPSSTSVEEVYL